MKHRIQVSCRTYGFAATGRRPVPECHVKQHRRSASQQHRQRELLTVRLESTYPATSPRDKERESPFLTWLKPLKEFIDRLGRVFYHVACVADKAGKRTLILRRLITTWWTCRTRC